MIPQSTVLIFYAMATFGIVGPILMIWAWKKRTGLPLKPVFVGALVFFSFAVALETLPKLILFQTGNPLGDYVLTHPWAYIVTGALLAGIFEETGRYVAFRVVLKNNREKGTAISCGIGHGGFEVMYILGLGAVQYVIYCTMINSGQFETILAEMAATAPDQAASLAGLPQTLMATTYGTLCLSLMERVSAVMIHISCSIMVFAGVRQGKRWLFPAAILVHTGMDLFAGLYQIGVITNLVVLESVLLAWTAGMLFATVKYIYRPMPEEPSAGLRS